MRSSHSEWRDGVLAKGGVMNKNPFIDEGDKQWTTG